MSILASKRSLAIVVAVLCLGGQAASAQVAPVQYWIPGGPFGYGGSSTDDPTSAAYSLEAGDIRSSGFSYRRYNFPSGFFIGSGAGGFGLNGIGQAGAFGSFGALSYQGTQFGYNFKGAGGIPVTVFAGFDALKYDPAGSGLLTPFSSTSATVPGYRAQAGIEFQPVPNLSLSLGVGYTQLQSGRIDSDINSPLLPGQSPVLGGR